MRTVLVTLAAVAMMVSAPAFAAQDGTTPPAPAPAPAPTEAPAKPVKPKEDPDRIVCTREHVVGSNRPQKVCMTVAQRDAQRDAASRFLQEQRGATEVRAGVGR